MELFIKNLLGNRCMMIVKLELEKIGLNCYELDLRRVVTKEIPAYEQICKFRMGLLRSGPGLLEIKKNILIKKIKHVFLEMVNYLKGPLKINFSEYLSKKSDFNFTCITDIFSETAGNSLGQFIINNRIRWIKEWIWLNELIPNEISRRRHYSRVAPLHTQCDTVSCLNPTCFKRMSICHIGLESV